MTARDPSDRLSAAEYLERWASSGNSSSASATSHASAAVVSSNRGFFPAYFNRLHDFCASLMTKDADQTAAAIAKAGSSVATYDVTISTHTRTHAPRVNP